MDFEADYERAEDEPNMRERRKKKREKWGEGRIAEWKRRQLSF